MSNRWFVGTLVSAFFAGIILTILAFMVFDKPIIEEKVIYTNSITTVDVNEGVALKSIAQLFDSLPNNSWMSFSIHYRAGSKIWRLNLDYDEREYKQEFDSYDDFIIFISDKKLYYDAVMDLGK